MFESLRPLSDSQIISGTMSARAQEHGGMLSLLGFLLEIERRKIYLKLGYSSMFKYCTAALGHSESEAMLRISVSRCVARFPKIYPLLEGREVSLSTVSRVSGILTSENCSAVLERIRRKSMREVEAIAAEYDPKSALPKDRIKTVVVRVPVGQAATIKQAVMMSPKTADRAEESVAELQNDIGRPGFHLCNSGKESSTTEESTSRPAPANAEFQLERHSIVQICADDEFMKMLDQVRSLASHELRGNAPLQDVIRIAMRYYIKHRDPNAREARRNARTDKKGHAQPRASLNHPRQVPLPVRDQIFVRDKRCTYVGPDGRRCCSTHVLQVDHIKPVARGGASTQDNLRLLCAYHNRLEAERLMGRGGPSAPRQC